MAGIKRKLDTRPATDAADSHNAPELQQNAPATSSGRARGMGRGNGRGGRPRGSGRGSSSMNGSRGAASEQTQFPETPQKKRPRRSKEEPLVEEPDPAKAARSTRQSARIQSRFKSVEPESEPIDMQLPVASGSGANNAVENATPQPQDGSSSTSQSNSFKSTGTEPSAEESLFRSTELKKESDAVSGDASKDSKDPTDARSERRKLRSPEVLSSNGQPQRRSPRASRKRNASEEQNGAMDSPSPEDKRLKVESTEAPETTLSQYNGSDDAPTSEPASAPSSVPEAPLGGPSPALSDEANSPSETPVIGASEISASPAATPPGSVESSATPSSVGRGRGRGGFRGRGRGRGIGRGRGRGIRGRGGRGGRGRRLQPLEAHRSPSPGPVIKQLRERQRELDKVFRRVAVAQRAALQVIATRSEARLVKDKKAHMTVKEYQEVMDALQERLQLRKDFIQEEYEYYKRAADLKLEGETGRINTNFYDKIRHIRDEHYLAAKGSFIDFVDKCRQAEDDDHTEAGSEPEPDAPLVREFVRGFNSSFVREPEGAALYEKGEHGWDDFIQRAKIGGDISPQMKEISRSGVISPRSFQRRLSYLIDAFMRSEERDELYQKAEEGPAAALSVLADAASNQRLPPPPMLGPPLFGPQAGPQLAPLRNLPSISQEMQPPYPGTPQSFGGRAILPQPVPPSQMVHGPTDPRSFLPPPPYPAQQSHPPPPSTPRGSVSNPPRRLLPASRSHPTIPPLNEQLNLPDPFSSSAPPQLPAPQSMPYPGPIQPPPQYMHGPPMPGYYQGYYPPPPHGHHIPPPPPPPLIPYPQHQPPPASGPSPPQQQPHPASRPY